MNLYTAAVYTSNISLKSTFYRKANEVEQKIVRELPHILESYHYVKNDRYVKMMREDSRRVFLDSGAFSAWSQGKEIDLNGYCEYIKTNRDIILEEDGKLLASVLDCIGDAKGTYINQKKMEEQGVVPLPCFHYGEDERYLKHYIENYPYITLGGMVAVHKKDLAVWLDRIWDKYLTNEKGEAVVKVHGFGLTTYNLLVRYPWHSVDSSSWVQVARTGGILLHGRKAIDVSSTSPGKKKHGAHYETLPELYKEEIKSILAKRGFDIERLSESYISRWIYCLATMGDLNDEVNSEPRNFKMTQRGLF